MFLFNLQIFIIFLFFLNKQDFVYSQNLQRFPTLPTFNHPNPWNPNNWAHADNSAPKYPDNRNYYHNTLNNNSPYLSRTHNVPSRFGNGWFVQCTTKNCATG
ncbi:hypothetical protein Mgra_00003994 [Meloidogyne graminicola]|uniref:Secreted protein n=1 Tax=Meloidogyne graminicola TaxID=189291 RepID=A0A8S9ZST8_9BILA|nr:hypothetical protein Mgra_00003994 [Meloidogyne graminicola]